MTLAIYKPVLTSHRISPLLTFKTLISTSLNTSAQFVYKYSRISSYEFIVKIIFGLMKEIQKNAAKKSISQIL